MEIVGSVVSVACLFWSVSIDKTSNQKHIYLFGCKTKVDIFLNKKYHVENKKISIMPNKKRV